MNDQHQSPWENPVVPTPSATSGDQGIGGGIDDTGGASGLTAVPWSNAPVPAPGNTDESGPFGQPSRFSSVDGSTHKGETLQGDITMPPVRTIDKK